ncbi:MAG: hypothetical protein AAF243_16850 [Cyanobacteria bacterium P01_A01_bin.137]
MGPQITPDLPNLELRPSVDGLVIEDDTPVDNFPTYFCSLANILAT